MTQPMVQDVRVPETRDLRPRFKISGWRSGASVTRASEGRETQHALPDHARLRSKHAAGRQKHQPNGKSSEATGPAQSLARSAF
jgi:hypothetical protein